MRAGPLDRRAELERARDAVERGRRLRAPRDEPAEGRRGSGRGNPGGRALDRFAHGVSWLRSARRCAIAAPARSSHCPASATAASAPRSALSSSICRTSTPMAEMRSPSCSRRTGHAPSESRPLRELDAQVRELLPERAPGGRTPSAGLSSPAPPRTGRRRPRCPRESGCR